MKPQRDGRVRCSAWLGGMVVVMAWRWWRARKWSLLQLVTASLVVNVLTMCCLLERARRERAATPPQQETLPPRPTPSQQSNSPAPTAAVTRQSGRDDAARSAQRSAETGPSPSPALSEMCAWKEYGGYAFAFGRTWRETPGSQTAEYEPLRTPPTYRWKAAQAGHQPMLYLCLTKMP